MARTDLEVFATAKPSAAKARGLCQPRQTDCWPCERCGVFVPVADDGLTQHDCDPALLRLVERGEYGGGDGT